MKCLKSNKTGNIIRVSDKDAYAATSEWKFIPKSEWKAQFKKFKVEDIPTIEQEIAQETKTISEKQLSKKNKK